MDKSDISTLIGRGESLTVEFKAELSSKSPKSICKEVAALATMGGGELIIGVSDSGEILGIEGPTIVQNRIENWTAELVFPVPPLNFSIPEIEDKTVLLVSVGTTTAPYHEYQGRAYFRVGTASRKASPFDVETLVRQSEVSTALREQKEELSTLAQQITADSIVKDAAISNASAEALARFVELSAAIEAARPEHHMAAAIMSQGELATLQYKDILERLIVDLQEFFVPKEGG